VCLLDCDVVVVALIADVVVVVTVVVIASAVKTADLHVCPWQLMPVVVQWQV
jgi:hypothetical protein